MRAMGRIQAVVINNAAAIRWTRHYQARCGKAELLMPGGRNKFVQLLKWSLELLGVVGNYTPAGFRAGGATHYFTEGMDIARLRVLGRWRNILTLDHYIQEAAAAISEYELGEYTQTRLSAFVRQAGFLRRPPQA